MFYWAPHPCEVRLSNRGFRDGKGTTDNIGFQRKILQAPSLHTVRHRDAGRQRRDNRRGDRKLKPEIIDEHEDRDRKAGPSVPSSSGLRKEVGEQ